MCVFRIPQHSNIFKSDEAFRAIVCSASYKVRRTKISISTKLIHFYIYIYTYTYNPRSAVRLDIKSRVNPLAAPIYTIYIPRQHSTSFENLRFHIPKIHWIFSPFNLLRQLYTGSSWLRQKKKQSNRKRLYIYIVSWKRQRIYRCANESTSSRLLMRF